MPMYLSFFHNVEETQNRWFQNRRIPEQLNFLFYENKTIGKDVTMTHCLISVLSMIDWTMQIHGADYLTCMIHAANCPG